MMFILILGMPQARPTLLPRSFKTTLGVANVNYNRKILILLAKGVLHTVAFPHQMESFNRRFV